MTQTEIDATRAAIALLKDALRRTCENRPKGVSIDITKWHWNAANYLFRSLPVSERY